MILRHIQSPIYQSPAQTTAVGAGTALMCSVQGNILAGAGYGAMLGLVQAPKSYAG